jgi:hypothetical protein
MNVFLMVKEYAALPPVINKTGFYFMQSTEPDPF